jgi:hypothetical protein
MLKVLLPTTLPTAMSRSPFSAAVTEVATSGIEVPMATMVRPITTSLTPSALAKRHRGSHQPSEPPTSSARPPTIISDLHRQPRPRRRRACGGVVAGLAALGTRLHDQEHRVGHQQHGQQGGVEGADAAVQAITSSSRRRRS